MTSQLNENQLQIQAMRTREMAGKQPNRLLQFFASLTASTLYASRPIVFDFSDYQAKADGTTAVDWVTIKSLNPQVAGGYCKLGEPWDNQACGSLGSDDWFQSSFDTNLNGLQKIGAWAAPYIFLNTARFLEGTIDNYWSLDKGTPEQRLRSWVTQDPHIYMAIRGLLIGTGRGITPPAGTTLMDWLKTRSRKRFHAIVLDLERWWRFYPIPTSPTDSQIISNVWIATILRGTVNRLQQLMQWGILPQVPILVYSGAWFVDRYLGTQAAALETLDTICAHYYWTPTYTPTTAPELSSKWLPQIPDSWRPYLFGKNPKIFQISGDKFAIPQVLNNLGKASAVDVNVFWGTDQEMKAYFPAWTDIDPEPPPPPPPPPPAETITIATTTAPVFMRQGPGTSYPTAMPTVMPIGTKLEVLETSTNGADTWRRVTWEFWVADTVNGKKYVTISEEPKTGAQS